MTTPRAAERLVLPAQFAVRFIDPATGRTVSDGLRVSLWPEGRPERAVAASVTPGGVFAAHPLGAPAPPGGWLVEVRDAEGRFLPLRFRASVPVPALHAWAPPEPPFESEPAGGVALFSAPTRRLPAGLAAVSADLRTLDGSPAAWALAEAHLVGRSGEPGPALGYGMADRRGRLLMPIQPPRTRPSFGAAADQAWMVRLSVRYAAGPPSAAPLWDTARLQPGVMALGALSPPAPLDDLAVQGGLVAIARTAGRSELVIAD